MWVNAGSPTGRESYGDGTPIVVNKRNEHRAKTKGQSPKEDESLPVDCGKQGRYR